METCTLPILFLAILFFKHNKAQIMTYYLTT